MNQPTIEGLEDRPGRLGELSRELLELRARLRLGGGLQRIHHIRYGDAARDTIECFGYESAGLLARIERGLAQRVRGGDLGRADADGLLAEYDRSLSSYTYLA